MAKDVSTATTAQLALASMASNRRSIVRSTVGLASMSAARTLLLKSNAETCRPFHRRTNRQDEPQPYEVSGR
jgi:hypothetical protein